MNSICLRSCYRGPFKFFGCTTPLVKTFFWSSPDFRGKNNSSTNAKTFFFFSLHLFSVGKIVADGEGFEEGGGGDMDPHFPKMGNCVKKVEDL